MSDTIDIYRAIKEHNRQERDSYIDSKMEKDISTIQKICDSFTRYTEYHCYLLKGVTTYDYWPTKQLMICRKTKKRFYGADNIIEKLGGSNE